MSASNLPASTVGTLSANDVTRACSAPEGAIPGLKGIEVHAMPAAPGDMPYLEIVGSPGGGIARIYHDPEFVEAARARAACFGGLLELLRPAIPDTRARQRWFDIVLTRDPAYTPPRNGNAKRWVVQGFTGRWDDAATRFLVGVMPHEETHGAQEALRSVTLPRWFQEGHAEWAGLQVTTHVLPALAATLRGELDRERALLPQPHLASWGGVHVTQEAILRQLSPEDRARVAADPTYSPPGPFSFGPSDFAEDNAHQQGRYAAALAVFEGLEKRHGRAALEKWITAVLRDTDNARIVPLAKEILGEDIEPLLR